MTDRAFDPGEFYFDYPVFVCAAAAGRRLAAILLNRGGQALPVFTDTDLAHHFLTVAGLGDQAQLLEIANPVFFGRLLEAQRGAGYTHVAFDPDGQSRAATVLPISEMLEELHRPEES